MKPNDRQKICASCEGRIPIDAFLCPYCAGEQLSSSPYNPAHAATPLFKNQSLQDSLSSLYTPPHQSKSSLGEEKKEPPKKEVDWSQEMYPKKAGEAPSKGEALRESSKTVPLEREEEGREFWPLLLLSTGGVLLTLGLLLFFFSEGGKLTLEWNSQYWFIYCLIAAPLLLWGLKKAGPAPAP